MIMNNFQRVISLQGSCNLRDLGGYETMDGRRVRHGHLFRSGVLAYFTDEDLRHLQELNVQVICDLRRAEERADEPTRWPGDTVKIRAWDDEPAMEAKGELAWRDSRSAEQVFEVMTGLYRTMPLWLEKRLQGVFESIVNGEVPLLFHCAAGKDRTGLVAALLLHTLGVPRHTILQDYALTNEAVDLEQFTLAHRKAGMGLTDRDHPLLSMPVSVRKALMAAEPSYLSAALEQIEQDYDSIENFLQHKIAVGPELIKDIQRVLLTD